MTESKSDKEGGFDLSWQNPLRSDLVKMAREDAREDAREVVQEFGDKLSKKINDLTKMLERQA